MGVCGDVGGVILKHARQPKVRDLHNRHYQRVEGWVSADLVALKQDLKCSMFCTAL